MSENKKKYAFWLEPSLMEEMESMLGEANATSKGDFVRQPPVSALRTGERGSFRA